MSRPTDPTDSTYSMRELIERYFEGCNRADIEMMTACFMPDAVHYFPPGTYGGPFVGARQIAERWAQSVATRGSIWTVDSFIGDAATHRAVIEWTHFKTGEGIVLRGDEWYRFDPDSGLIADIRAYYATPQPATVAPYELQGFDYAGEGYPTSAPPGWLARR